MAGEKRKVGVRVEWGPPPHCPQECLQCCVKAVQGPRGGGWRAPESGTRISISESLIKVFRMKKKEKLARGESPCIS